LLDLRAHFFAPTRQLPNAVGRRGCQGWPSLRYLLMPGDARPHLDSSEHGSTLGGRDDDVEGSSLVAHEQSCRNLVFGGPNDPNHDAVLRIGSEAPRRRAHSAQRHESHGFRGTPPPRTIIGTSPWCGSRPSGYWPTDIQ